MAKKLIPGFKLYTSNRLDRLVEKLATQLRNHRLPPLQEELIVIQSKGMERWISMELARRWGICANIFFSFPNTLLYDIHKRVIPGLPDTSPFEPGIMTWKVMKLLPSCIDKPGFQNVRSYLKGDSNIKCFQIAERIADIFDQYLIFRPEMILGWENSCRAYPRNKEEQWQAELWRMIVDDTDCPHRARLMEIFLKGMEQDPAWTANLPERISIFGISAMPPLHINFLAALAKCCEVNLFLINPCREYWGNILPDRQSYKISQQYGNNGVHLEDLHFEKGNSLLATLGMQGAEFFDLLLDSACDQHDLFADIQEESMLACTQSDILNLRDRGARSDKKTAVDKNDTSIQIHSCHSPMREIEVLYDNLLAVFAEVPGLRPHDVLVMTPDIDAYAPFIQAVFNAPENDSLRIPFSIADCSRLTAGSLCNTFLALFGLCGSRFGVSLVMPLLESPAVQRKFSFTENDIELIQSWIDETRIRWGIDETKRKEAGLPACRENTWMAGLERMLLGYAMPGNNEHLFNGILPYDKIEGESARTLGRFAEFTERLFSLCETLPRPKTLKEWAVALSDMLEHFFEPDRTDDNAWRAMQNAFSGLAAGQELSGLEHPLAIEVVGEYLKKMFGRGNKESGYITGAVTFCALLPMRSIPFKIICLTGMNDGSYPRQSHEAGFNLICQDPKPCDRSRKKTDRYLFLETILSAEKRLYISYTGRNVKDNSIIPPSVLVSELIDYLEQGFAGAGNTILDQVLTSHPLQAFSPRNFRQDPKLFSYSKENCACAQKLPGPKPAPGLFVAEGLPEPEDDCRTVDLADLTGFFANPAKYLLQKRLGIYLKKEDVLCKDRENFTVTGLDRYELENDMLTRQLGGSSREYVQRLSRARGILPHGTVGELVCDKAVDDTSGFMEFISGFSAADQAAPLGIDLTIDNFRLTGRIQNINRSCHVNYRYAAVKPKDFLTSWLVHAALNAVESDFESIIIGLNNKRMPVAWRYTPPQNCLTILKGLLDIYWEGLMRPVSFFPKASFVFAEALIKNNKSEEAALGSALRELHGSDYSPGDLDDAYYKLCFGKSYTPDQQFRHYALAVYQPLLKYLKEVMLPAHSAGP